MTTDTPAADTNTRESLASLLGGARGTIDATLPVAAFVVGWLLSDDSVGVGAAAAAVVALAVAAWRLRQGAKPRAVLVGCLAVCAGALVALYTGRAEDFFLIQIFTNAASALAWVVSIALRWPLLGVVVGGVLGQKTRWRRDPALLRAYSRASWIWVAQYVVRLVVMLPLWAAGWVAALGVARIALTWPLIAACLAVSWWVLSRTLPPDHPGLRHPSPPTDTRRLVDHGPAPEALEDRDAPAETAVRVHDLPASADHRGRSQPGPWRAPPRSR